MKTENSRNLYYKTEKNLFLKKEELFRGKNIVKWDLSPEDTLNCDKNLLIISKELAFAKMCHKVILTLI